MGVVGVCPLSITKSATLVTQVQFDLESPNFTQTFYTSDVTSGTTVEEASDRKLALTV